MYATILNLLIFGILGYIGLFSLDDNATNPTKKFNYLLYSIRFLQTIQVLVTILLIVDLLIFLVSGDFSITKTPFFNTDFSSVFHYGEPILVSFSVVINIIYLGITQIVHQVISKMKETMHFDKEIVISLRLISRLFVVFVLTSFGSSFVQTGLFTFRFDTVFYYALLIVFIKVFEQAVIVQEDSDLSI